MHSPDHSRAYRRLGGLLGAWIFLLWAGLQSAAAAPASTILVFGDSLSASYGVPVERSWVTLLEKRLDIMDKPYRVINASISGETTDGGLRRLPEVLARTKPALVILELGGNDGLRGFPLKVVQENLSRMVTAALDANAKVLLVGMRIPPNYGKRYTEGFQQLYGQISDQHDTPLVPFMLEEIAVKPELMQDDRIHPRAEAQAQILDNIWPHLEPLL